MKSDIRRQALENYAKDVKSGLYLTEDYVKKHPNAKDTAFSYRDLSEDALANEVLKNTGVKIPGKGATKTQIENFFSDVMKERYPELKNNGIEVRKMKDSLGLYNPTTGIIQLDEDMIDRIRRGEPIESLATLLHELGHKYDYEYLKTPTTNDLTNKDIRAAVQKVKPNVTTDPTVIGEAVLEKHHSWIPKLREGSFGFGALKSMLRDGTFKALPIVGPAIGAGMAAMSGDANAASALPILGEAESLEPSPEDSVIENPQANPELRKKALQNLAGNK